MLETPKRDIWVLPFGRGQRGIPVPKKTVAGLRGHRLVRMAHAGLPVAPGIIFGTAFCETYFANKKGFPENVVQRLRGELSEFENYLLKTEALPLPLRLSVRTSAVVPEPGLMPTKLDSILDGSDANRDRLLDVVTEAFASWGWERAQVFQKLNAEAALTGMAVVVQAMGENYHPDGQLQRLKSRDRTTGDLNTIAGDPEKVTLLTDMRDQLERHLSRPVQFDCLISAHGGLIRGRNAAIRRATPPPDCTLPRISRTARSGGSGATPAPAQGPRAPCARENHAENPRNVCSPAGHSDPRSK